MGEFLRLLDTRLGQRLFEEVTARLDSIRLDLEDIEDPSYVWTEEVLPLVRELRRTVGRLRVTLGQPPRGPLFD